MYGIGRMMARNAQSSSDAAIAFKRVNDYDWVYDDSGTGADRDVSIWRPSDNEAGFCALGDVVYASHNKPSISSVTVKALKSGALAHPSSFSEIWRDRGSGGKHNVKIMKMNPPNGYVCLGDVAVIGYSNTPNSNKYCCVKRQFVTTVGKRRIWKDSGSGAKRDVSFWQVLKTTQLKGINAGNFLTSTNYNEPSRTGYLLSESDKVVNTATILAGSSKQLAVYETTDMDLRWNDAKSGADKDVAIFRVRAPDGYYSLGDMAVPTHSKPRVAFMVKAVEDDALRQPVDFYREWSDAGSGARMDCQIWQPVCPSGYRSLGFVATSGSKPSYDSIRCVKGEYTVQGRWKYVWNDKGSGAKKDVTFWESEPSSGNGQGIKAMSSVTRHGSMTRTAFVLKSQNVAYYTNKPAKKYILKNVEYKLNLLEKLSVQPESIQVTVVTNKDSGPQTVRRERGYDYKETYSWSHNVGVEIGVATEVEAGIPLVGKSKGTVSVKTSYGYTWGGTVEEQKTDKAVMTMTVPGHSQMTGTVAGKRYTIDVPYKATLIKEYYDGTRATSVINGVYKGVTVGEINIEYSPASPL